MMTLKSVTTLVIILLLSGCMMESNAPEPDHSGADIPIEQITRMIASHHNMGLQHVLDKMNERTTPFNNREEVKLFVKESITSYLSTIPEVGIQYNDEELHFSSLFEFADVVRDNPGVSRSQLIIEHSDLDKGTRRHLKKLFDLYNPENGVSFFERDLGPSMKMVNRSIPLGLSEDDRLLTMGVSETLEASFDFWKENREEWISEFERLKPADSSLKMPSSASASASPCLATVPCFYLYFVEWEAVIVRDGGGLIAAAAGIGAANAISVILNVTPIGWTATAAALGGAAAAASAQEIYDQILALWGY